MLITAGVMLESNLIAGKQNLMAGVPLKYGQSITDACIDWPETILLLEKLAIAVKERRSIKHEYNEHIFE